MRPLTIICLFAGILSSSVATAQFEATWLSTKGQAIPGWAAFWDFAFRIDKGDYISFQPNFEYFGASNPYVWVDPNLVGYRYTFNRRGDHFFAEPLAGYTFGYTNIIATNAEGRPITTASGDTLSRSTNGFTGGLGIGYTFSWGIPFSMELRWEHVFVPASPKIDIVGLHFACTFVWRNRFS